MDNVYMYGRANGRPFTEDRGYDAHASKGRVRAAMARDLPAAHEAARVHVTVGRASHFLGYVTPQQVPSGAPMPERRSQVRAGER